MMNNDIDIDPADLVGTITIICEAFRIKPFLALRNIRTNGDSDLPLVEGMIMEIIASSQSNYRRSLDELINFFDALEIDQNG